MRQRLPSKRRGIRAVITGGAVSLHLSTGEYDDGKLGEIFCECAREGAFSRDIMAAFAISVSIGLQHGIELSTYHHAFRNFAMEPDLIRGIFELLEEHYDTQGSRVNRVTAPIESVENKVGNSV